MNGYIYSEAYVSDGTGEGNRGAGRGKDKTFWL